MQKLIERGFTILDPDGNNIPSTLLVEGYKLVVDDEGVILFKTGEPTFVWAHCQWYVVRPPTWAHSEILSPCDPVQYLGLLPLLVLDDGTHEPEQSL